MQDKPPDAWQVCTTIKGVESRGNEQHLEDALDEFAFLWSHYGTKLDTIEIAPVWDTEKKRE